MLTPTYPIDQIGVQERVARLATRSIKKESKIHALTLALSMIDLTTLEGRDSPGKVRQLCYKATHLHERFPGLPHVAAVCVYAPMIQVAKESLHGSGVKVAAVATAFPSGMSSLDTKLAEVTRAVQDGADEIDMVISRGRFLSGDYCYVSDEIAQVKEACGQAAPARREVYGAVAQQRRLGGGRTTRTRWRRRGRTERSISFSAI